MTVFCFFAVLGTRRRKALPQPRVADQLCPQPDYIQHGCAMRRCGLSPDQVDTAIHLYNSGSSLARVGERLGVDPTTVLRPPATWRRHPRHTPGDLGLDVLAAVRRYVIRQRHLEPFPPRDGYTAGSWQRVLANLSCG